MSNSDMADCKSFARQQNPENIDPSLLYVAYEPGDIGTNPLSLADTAVHALILPQKREVEVDLKTALLFFQNSERLTRFFGSFVILRLQSFRGMIHPSIHRAFTA